MNAQTTIIAMGMRALRKPGLIESCLPIPKGDSCFTLKDLDNALAKMRLSHEHAKIVLKAVESNVEARNFKHMFELRYMLNQSQFDEIKSVKDLFLTVERLFEKPTLPMLGVPPCAFECDYEDVRQLVLGVRFIYPEESWLEALIEKIEDKLKKCGNNG